MERNSVQGNNCSFGYIEFNLIEVIDAIASSVNHFCFPIQSETPTTEMKATPTTESGAVKLATSGAVMILVAAMLFF